MYTLHVTYYMHACIMHYIYVNGSAKAAWDTCTNYIKSCSEAGCFVYDSYSNKSAMQPINYDCFLIDL